MDIKKFAVTTTMTGALGLGALGLGAGFASADPVVPQPPPIPVPVVPDVNVPAHDLDYLTNFERKYRKEGRPIQRGCYRRR